MKFFIEIIDLILSVLAHKDELMKIKKLNEWFKKTGKGLIGILNWRAESNIKKDLIGLSGFSIKIGFLFLGLSFLARAVGFYKLQSAFTIMFGIAILIGFSLKWGIDPIKDSKIFLIDISKVYGIVFLVSLWFKSEALVVLTNSNFVNLSPTKEVLLLLSLFFVGFIPVICLILIWSLINSIIVSVFLVLFYFSIHSSRFILNICSKMKINSTSIAVATVCFVIFKVLYGAF